MNRRELREPERVTVANIGLRAGTARTARPGKHLHLFGRDLLALFVGAGDGRDGFQFDKARHGIGGIAPDDLSVSIEKSQGALAAHVV
ncbi:MAG: hypothetical protein R3E14_06570 [Erythrobacter sp.]